MLESMSAGLVCVHPNVGALPETSGGLNIMYHADLESKDNHANVFGKHLNAAINIVRDGGHKDMIQFNKMFVDSRYNLPRIKSQWESMLKHLVLNHPTVESRGKPKPQFVYRTS